ASTTATEAASPRCPSNSTKSRNNTVTCSRFPMASVNGGATGAAPVGEVRSFGGPSQRRSGDRATHGAACHGCLLIAETSCEMRNLFLDRSLLVPTMATHGGAFFNVPAYR